MKRRSLIPDDQANKPSAGLMSQDFITADEGRRGCACLPASLLTRLLACSRQRGAHWRQQTARERERERIGRLRGSDESASEGREREDQERTSGGDIIDLKFVVEAPAASAGYQKQASHASPSLGWSRVADSSNHRPPLVRLSTHGGRRRERS